MATFEFDVFAALEQPPVRWRDDLFLPRSWEVEVDDHPRLPYRLMLSIKAVEDGQPVLDGVRFSRRDGGPPVTHRIMRQARIGEYLQQAAHLMALTRERLPGGGVSYEPAVRPGDQFDVYPEGGSRHARITDAHKREVAKVYNDAVKGGSRTPRKAVQEDPRWRPVATQTAARWIRLAKDAALIPESGEPG